MLPVVWETVDLTLSHYKGLISLSTCVKCIVQMFQGKWVYRAVSHSEFDLGKVSLLLVLEKEKQTPTTAAKCQENLLSFLFMNR